ncbi:MAG TPA: hypothetical protein VGN17_21380 [Bryobacteraceae bacterium]|jgi:hypothetical protein
MSKTRLLLAMTMISTTGFAQWINYPISGTPRTKEGKADLTAPPPKASDGKPDLSGLWTSRRPAGATRESQNDVGPDIRSYIEPPNEPPVLLPEAAALFQKRFDTLGAGRPSESCLPHSIPDMMLIGRPFKFVQNPNLTLILYEFATRYRQILTDGRPHPAAMEPAWFGYSIGKWDGNTFVIDTRGFNDKSWLDDVGHPHTDALHTIERFRRLDFGHMTMDVTIDDPKAYAKPWTATVHFALIPDSELIEDICENEKDSAHAVGR